jgi:hypothetical protein
VKIPDRQTRGAGGIKPERARAARGHEKMRSPRRAQQPKSGKPLVAHAVDRQGHHAFAGRRYDDRPPGPKFGKTTLYCDLFGRAKQTRRSTPSHFTHTLFGSRRPQTRTDRRKTRPGALYSGGGVFFVARVCSHLPAKYHGTMLEAPKAGI